MVDMSTFKTKIADGHPVFGIVLRSSEKAIAELVGLTGFDYAWLDMEHSVMTFDQVETLVITLEARDCVSLVRVPSNDANSIGRALDLAAHIVAIPHVETPEEAKRAVAGAKYYPLGRRGFASSSRSNRLGIEPLDKAVMQQKNNQTMVMVQIESRVGMQNVESIAQVEGVDILFLGLGDLSQDMGVPGEYEHAAIGDAMKQFNKAVSRAGKISATAIPNIAGLDQYLGLGFQMLTCGVETLLMRDALKMLMRDISSRGKS